jgi:MFS family permease
MMSATQLIGFVGPTVAGILIGSYAHSLRGVGIAFAVDSFSFVVSAACLWLMRAGKQAGLAAQLASGESIWQSILAGIRYLWSDSNLRLLFTVMVAANFLLLGPLLVGIPVLANQRLPEGAVAFGLLMSAYAGGNLAGYLVAGSLPRPNGTTIRVLLVALLAAFGVGFSSLGFLRSTWADFAVMLLLGLGNGYIGIILFTWMQVRTPHEMLGRMMSLVMFASNGLVPVSQAIAGAVSKWNLTLLFAGAGGLLLLVSVWTALQRELKRFSESLAAEATVGAGQKPAGEGTKGA